MIVPIKNIFYKKNKINHKGKWEKTDYLVLLLEGIYNKLHWHKLKK